MSNSAPDRLELIAHKIFVPYRSFLAASDEIVVTRIAGDTATNLASWSLLVNFTSAHLGGCSQEMHAEDAVLWAFHGFAVDRLLKLDGPDFTLVAFSNIYTVTDSATGVPVAGATVTASDDGTTVVTDDEGNAEFVFFNTGTLTVKADKEGTIRSPAVTVFVGSR